MPGAPNQLVGSHQRIPATGTLNIDLRALVFSFMSRYDSCIKRVRSHPSVVRFFQIGELNSSLGVPESSYMLENTYHCT